MEEQTPQPLGIEAENATTIIVNERDVVSSSTGSNPVQSTDDRPGVSGVHLLLMCLNTDRHVTFHEGVIDNEGMNRHKSKCCCIYRKPHVFGESSSSSDDECEHCCGHPEVRLRNRLKKQQQQQQQQQSQLCQCGCQQHSPNHHHQHHHHSQPQPEAQVQHEVAANHTEIAGDSGSVKIKDASTTLLSTSSHATTQHS